MVNFTSCNASSAPSPAAQTARAVNTDFSECLVLVPAGATKVVVASFFISRWNPVKAAAVAASGGPAAEVTVRVSAVSVADATVTLTLSVPAPVGTWVEVEF